MKPALRKPSRAHSVVGSRQATAAKAARQCPVVRAESSAEVSRRGALVALTGAAAAVSSSSQAALAAYGERANVFGKKTADTDFYPYAGEGFQLSVPGKWNPTKEVEYPGQQVRYEDNYDTVSSLYVSKIPSSKGNIKDYGEPLKFLEQFSDVLGKQSSRAARRPRAASTRTACPSRRSSPRMPLSATASRTTRSTSSPARRTATRAAATSSSPRALARTKTSTS